jgi:hypothetical protein
MSYFSDSDFQDALDSELAWRVKEVDSLKNIIRSTPDPLKKTYIRAGIALLYAHWEGFIKVSSENYFKLVSSKRVKSSDLRLTLVGLALKKELSTAFQGNNSVQITESIEKVVSNTYGHKRFRLKWAIDTKSNLNSQVFLEILGWTGIDSGKFSSYSNLIDESLLKKRNAIAHGERGDVDDVDFPSLSGEIIKLMYMYKTELSNSASLKLYLRQVPSFPKVS